MAPVCRSVIVCVCRRDSPMMMTLVYNNNNTTLYMLLLGEDESFLFYFGKCHHQHTDGENKEAGPQYGRPVFPVCAFLLSSETNLLDKSRGEKE